MQLNYEKPVINFYKFDTEGVMLTVSNPDATIITNPPGLGEGEDELD